MGALISIVSVALIYAIYVVLRSFAIDDGSVVEHLSTWVVATLAYLAWTRIITRK